MSAAAAIGLLPDVERLVSAYLREQPELVALVSDRVYTAFPREAGPEPLLLLQRVGGDPVIPQPLVFDRAQLQVSAYGGPKAQASALARTAMRALALLEGRARPEGDVAAVDLRALRWLPDEAFEPARPRYLFDVYLSVKAPRSPAALGTTRRPVAGGTLSSPKGG